MAHVALSMVIAICASYTALTLAGRVSAEIDEVIVRADASGRWTFLNSAWLQITGFEIADSLGRAVQDFVHQEDPGARMRPRPGIFVREAACG